jgi:large conductance mechanosensitive channel
MSGFRKFILRGNVVDLAVGIVIGAAFTGVVQALVKGLITPFIGVFGGIPDFSDWYVTINTSRFAVGEFINALLSFLIVSAVVYFFVVAPVNRLMDRFKPEGSIELRKRDCPRCLSKIPYLADRGAFCTADIGPADLPPGVRPAVDAPRSLSQT